MGDEALITLVAPKALIVFRLRCMVTSPTSVSPVNAPRNEITRLSLPREDERTSHPGLADGTRIRCASGRRRANERCGDPRSIVVFGRRGGKRGCTITSNWFCDLGSAGDVAVHGVQQFRCRSSDHHGGDVGREQWCRVRVVRVNLYLVFDHDEQRFRDCTVRRSQVCQRHTQNAAASSFAVSMASTRRAASATPSPS